MRLFATGVVALIGLPVLLPVLGLVVIVQTWARSLAWPVATSRRGTWYWQLWWWYGYHLGLYRLDWWMKRRREPGIHDWCATR